MDRKMNYAGSFYPAKADELIRMMDSFLSKTNFESEDKSVLGLICPHAGYVYSGATAAYTYQYLKDRLIRNLFIIAPNHRGGSCPFSVLDYKKLQTPLGDLTTNYSVIESLITHPDFSFDLHQDLQEHSLEVQLPFIYHVLPEVNVIPILFNYQNYEHSLKLAEILSPWFQNETDENILLISSDFSHYHSARTAEKMDSDAIKLICELQTEAFYEMIKYRKIEACGFGGILVLMHLAKQKGYRQIRLLNYTHSGMVSLDFNQVVGYASIVFEKE